MSEDVNNDIEDIRLILDSVGLKGRVTCQDGEYLVTVTRKSVAAREKVWGTLSKLLGKTYHRFKVIRLDRHETAKSYQVVATIGVYRPVASPPTDALAAEKARLARVRADRSVRRITETDQACEDFLAAIRKDRVDPDCLTMRAWQGMMVVVVPESDVTFKRLRDRARKINNKMRRIDSQWRVTVDHQAEWIILKRVTN